MGDPGTVGLVRTQNKRGFVKEEQAQLRVDD